MSGRHGAEVKAGGYDRFGNLCVADCTLRMPTLSPPGSCPRPVDPSPAMVRCHAVKFVERVSNAGLAPTVYHAGKLSVYGPGSAVWAHRGVSPHDDVDPYGPLTWSADSLARLSKYAADGAGDWAATAVLAVFSSERAALAAEQHLAETLSDATGLDAANALPWSPGKRSQGAATHFAVYLQVK